MRGSRSDAFVAGLTSALARSRGGSTSGAGASPPGSLMSMTSSPVSMSRSGSPGSGGFLVRAWGDRAELGDYIFTKALHELVERRLDTLVPVVARTIYHMAIGEMLQIQQKEDLDLGEDAYFELVDQKTASLMGASTEIGALVGRLGAERTARFRRFGELLGRAYQVTDDLFDYIGDPVRIGKGVRTDLPDGKVTLPLIRGLAGAGARDRVRLRELAARKEPGPEGWDDLLSILDRAGAIDSCRDTARALAGECVLTLRDEPASRWRDALEQAVAYAVHRLH